MNSNKKLILIIIGISALCCIFLVIAAVLAFKYSEGSSEICSAKVDDDLKIQVRYENFNIDNPRSQYLSVSYKNGPWEDFFVDSVTLHKIQTQMNINDDSKANPEICNKLAKDLIYKKTGKYVLIEEKLSVDEGKSFIDSTQMGQIFALEINKNLEVYKKEYSLILPEYNEKFISYHFSDNTYRLFEDRVESTMTTSENQIIKLEYRNNSWRVVSIDGKRVEN